MINYTQQISGLRQHLRQAETLPDSYAALRHALFLTALQKDDTRDVSAVPSLLTNHHEPPDDVLTQVSMQEFAFSHFPGLLRSVKHVSLKSAELETTAILRGICRGHIPVESGFLLDQIGRSEQKNMLVREALRYSIPQQNHQQIMAELRQRLFRKASQKDYFSVVTFLDLAAEFELDVLKNDELETLLKKWAQHEQIFLALLRYVTAFQKKNTTSTLHEFFSEFYRLSLSAYIALIDTLAQVYNSESLRALRRFEERVPQLFEGQQAQQLRWRSQLASAAIESQDALAVMTHHDKIVLAQCMFQGLVGQPGKGNSGGLGVFLTSLGDALAQTDSIAQVYTLVLDPIGSQDNFCQLCEQISPDHTLVKIPVYLDPGTTQDDFVIHEYALRTSIEWTLKRYHIEPDVFHIRYSDIGSKIILDLAKQLGKKVVFTVTPDPHRNMEQRFADQVLDDIQAQDLEDTLHKVYISDYLLEQADGLIAMPTQSGIAHLSAYFPQLHLSPTLRAKPLQVIPEGIVLDLPEPDSSSGAQKLFEKLFQESSHSKFRGYKIAERFRHHPIMLNVGRLHPVKQQDLLVEAWASSDLWKVYNLVLVSGNLEEPNETEKRMLTHIENLIERYPHISGRLCFTGAMSNSDLRLLEHDIVRQAENDHPPVYVCSSVKEEFGIAILEAMSAGFLLFGPERGGLSSYVHHAENGFLLDTRSAHAVAASLTRILLAQQAEKEDLQAIADAGQKTVRERFDIGQIAPQFAEFYHHIITADQKKRN